MARRYRRTEEGYVRQRTGELEHHKWFAKNPTAYLVWNRMRMLCDWKTGLLDMGPREIAGDVWSTATVIRCMRWLARAGKDGRPPYIQRVTKGHKGRSSLWQIIKHESLYQHRRTKAEPKKAEDGLGVRSATQSGQDQVSDLQPNTEIRCQICNSIGGIRCQICNLIEDEPTQRQRVTAPKNNVVVGTSYTSSKEKELRRGRTPPAKPKSIAEGARDPVRGLTAGEIRAQRRKAASYDPRGPQAFEIETLSDIVRRQWRQGDETT